MKRPLLLAVLLVAIAAAPSAAPGGEWPRRTAIVAAVERAGPGVVNISTEQVMVRRGEPFFGFRDPFFDEYFRDFFERFRQPQRFRTTSLGSGVLIDPEGYVVTNEHVVRRASKIHVKLSDGRQFEGRLLSADAESDLALVKVDAEQPLPTVPMGHSDDLMIGETVIALGNPFGLESTVTVGVVSATNRSVMLGGQEAYSGLIQADAAINPGNSGGALVNINGRLIGINVAIYAEAQGIGFAIPVDRVRSILCALFNYRLIKKTYIGVKIEERAAAEGGPPAAGRRRAVVVAAVDPGSPAEKAGLKAGDAILAVDGQPVGETMGFFKAMLRKDVGDTASLRIRRDGRERTVPVPIGSVPRPSGGQLARQKLGLGLQPMSPDLARSFGLRRPRGLLVAEVEPGGPGGRAGLERGDIIVRFGPTAINTLRELAIVLEQLGEARVLLVVVRGGHLYRAVITTR